MGKTPVQAHLFPAAAGSRILSGRITQYFLVLTQDPNTDQIKIRTLVRFMVAKGCVPVEIMAWVFCVSF
jgi:hypothetical protein